MRRIQYSAIAAVLLASGCGGSGGVDPAANLDTAAAPILTESIDRIPESQGIWVWGSGANKLCQQWSAARNDQSGYFYGTSFIWSSADVYVLKAPENPLSVTAAENFDYVNSFVEAFEGDTVFFRGRNGFFGAWRIDNVEGASSDAVLSGTWYFKQDGGGDFTRSVDESDNPMEDVGGGDCIGY